MTESLWKKEWNDHCLFSHGTSASTGVCILFKNVSSLHIVKQFHDDCGRLLVCQVKIGEDMLTLCNVYGPNNDNPTFFDKCLDVLTEFNGCYIIGGDFNTVLNPHMDKCGGRENTHVRARIRICNLMDNLNVTDIWREHHSNIKNYTWKSSSKPPILCRLDYFLISKTLSARIKFSNISHGFKSDHSLISLSISPQISRGPGFWKLNTSLLKDNEYVGVIKETIDKTKQECVGNNPNTVWEMIKLNVRDSTMKYASKKKRNTDSIIKTLTNEINDLDMKCKDNPSDETLRAKLKEKEKILEDIYDEKAQGIYIRSKAQWVEDGEKSSKYFLSLEKVHSEKKVIHKLIVDGKEIQKPDDILKAEANFYQDLYSDSDTDDDILNSFFLTTSISKLDNEGCTQCEGYLSIQECWNAVDSMPNNKSPGTDGFPCEFYKIFWTHIQEPLIKSFNYSFDEGELSVSQKRGIITLLPKKDKSNMFLKNWRPISLLNVDYKIITKALANRMKKVLVNIIHHDQTGFLKGRYIGENVRLLLDIINYTDIQNIPGFAFAIDFEKAFDKIKWSCINKALSHFGFGHDFQKWVKIIYNGAQSCVTNNGYASEFFRLSRGVRQGCCLSPYIFLICSELLSHAIRTSEIIKGISVFTTGSSGERTNYDVKISQYADDTIVYTDGSRESLNETLLILDKFAEFSGLQVNCDKSTVLRLGSLKTSNEILFPERQLKWSNSSFVYLGMHISHNTKDMVEFNFNAKLAEIKSTLQLWKGRNLTLLGKITLIKAFALSKLVYPFSVFPSPPEDFFKRLDQILYDFVWNGTPDKIKRKTLILPVTEGGLGMPDCRNFCKVLKIVWIKRFYDKSEDVRWKIVFANSLESLGGMLLFKCNFKEDEQFINEIKNPFVRDLVKCWALVHYKEPENNQDLLNQILWLNSEIRIGKKVFFWKKWYKYGIVYFKDIITEDMELMGFPEVKEKLHENFRWFEYYKLISAIPNKWKNTLKICHADDMPQGPDDVFSILGKPFCNKTIREKMLQKVYVLPNRIIEKWNNLVPNHNYDWSDIFHLAFKCAIDSKTRNFQFKFLHRIIATNDFLYKLQIIESNLCTFCGVEIETLEHVFYECDIIKDFWNRVGAWINDKVGSDVSANRENIFLGYNVTNPPMAINYIILLGKQFIYKCKLHKTTPKCFVFVRNINDFIKIEHIIASNKNKLSSHYAKWDGFL